LLDRKKELRKNGIPSDAEHAMVAATKGKADTPAAAARSTGFIRRPSARAATAKRRSRSKVASASFASKRSKRAGKSRRTAHK
jgi:hypothetical protein